MAACVAQPLLAQEATISRSIQGLLDRDTVLTVWVFGRPLVSLDALGNEIRSAGGTLRERSRWLTANSAELSTRGISQLTSSPLVRHIQPVARWRGAPEPLTTLSPGEPALRTGFATTSASEMPFRILNVSRLRDVGLRGTGIRIAVLDTGFETGLPEFSGTNVIAARDFVFGDDTVANQSEDEPAASQHGTATWSLLASESSTLLGFAPGADYILAKTEDTRAETRIEEDHLVAALEWADSLDARIASISLGYLTFDDGFSYGFDDLNGDVAVTTIAADEAARRGMLVVASVGNEGPGSRSLSTPADGDSVLAAGAVDSLGALASFSSRGPTADLRNKPDLLAPGVDVLVVDPLSPSGFSRVSGTSASAPLIAGMAALLLELHPTLGAAELLERLRSSGSNAERPDTLSGWGIPSGLQVATYPMGVRITSPSPSDSVLSRVTPIFGWFVPLAPGFARPYSYRVRLARDSSFSTVVADTTLSRENFEFPVPQLPDSRIHVEVTARSADGEVFSTTAGAFVAPPWLELLVLDDPAGSVVRETQPTFVWASPPIAVPPGPFTYDLQVTRAEDQAVELDVQGLTDTTYRAERELELNTPYEWQVTARVGDLESTVQSPGTFLIVDNSAPATTVLFQNFPNPFPRAVTARSSTCIWFDLAVPSPVSLDVLDLTGRMVRNLIPGSDFEAFLPPGRYGRAGGSDAGPCDPRFEWDGTASDGTEVPRGVYLARLRTQTGTFFKRMVFLGSSP